MSWRELQRLVDDAEGSTELGQALRGCRDGTELLLRARRLGYRITRIDLQRAWLEHQQAGLRRKGARASC